MPNQSSRTLLCWVFAVGAGLKILMGLVFQVTRFLPRFSPMDDDFRRLEMVYSLLGCCGIVIDLVTYGSLIMLLFAFASDSRRMYATLMNQQANDQFVPVPTPLNPASSYGGPPPLPPVGPNTDDARHDGI